MTEGRPLRVLLVEDVEDDADLVLRELVKGGYEPTHRRVESAADMEDALSRQEWDLVLSDYNLPGFDALAALRLLQARELDVPFIIVSGQVGEDAAVEAMKLGANDYLVKGKLKRLMPAIERELRDVRVRAERRIVEEALRKSEARFRALVETLPEFIAVSRRGHLLYVNPHLEMVLGRSAAELIGQSRLIFVHPDDREIAAQQLAQVAVTGRSSPMREQRWLRADETEVVVEAVAQALEYDGGLAIVTVARDVSQRKKMELALRASEERFRTLVASIDDFVLVLDRQGRVTGAYGRALHEEGLWSPALVGKLLQEVLPEEAAQAHQAAIARVLAGESVTIDFEVGGERGAISYQTSLSPIAGPGGKPAGVVGVGREVTESKRVQAQLLVSDRMASVGTLAAGVAHEINNPLSAVLANVQYSAGVVGDVMGMIARATPAAIGEAVAGLREPLEDAQAAALRVQEIVRDLRMFSRGGSEERREAVDVRGILDSSARMAWNEIRHRARLIKDYHDVPVVDGNEARLGQVFLNLIVNAAQAIAEGRADQNHIRLSTRLDDGWVVVEVEDTGAGISSEVLPRLFTPFFTTKPVGVGTGLGLSICHRIVTGLGGEIQVLSRVGRGTTFRVLLRPSTKRPSRQHAPTPPRELGARRAGKILVIDDEPMIGAALRRALAPEHEVMTVTSGSEAIAHIRGGKRFDIILCDLMMPETTGMDLHAELEGLAPDQAQKMIFVTGGAFTERARKFLEAGYPTVHKPFDLTELRWIVNERIR